MKKVFLFAAMALAMHGVNANTVDHTPENNIEIAGETPMAEPVAAPSIVGKWLVVDMKMQVPAGQKQPTHAEIVEQLKKQNMVYEFMADGTSTITAGGGMEPITGTYKKVGNKLMTDNGKGQKETVDIVKLTEKDMTLKLVKEKMTFIMEKI